MRHGSPFEAYYYIASLHASRAQDPASTPAMIAGSCPFAVSFYKLVAERGCWKEDLLAEAEVLWQAATEKNKGKTGLLGSGTGGDGAKQREGAMLRWFIAADRGYEIAQNNIAWVLDQGKCYSLIGSRHLCLRLDWHRQTRAAFVIRASQVHHRM